jgi:drug/metabolite transporter (DMT)-like permease
MQSRTRKLALSEGVTAGVLFGTAAIFIRFLSDLDAFSIAFWRLIIASIALTVPLAVFGKSFQFNIVRKYAKELSILGFFIALHFIFFISAVKDTTILNATVLVNTTPIFSMFVSSFFYNLKPSRLAILGLTISFGGVCVIAYADASQLGTSSSLGGFSSSLKGDIEAVLAALVEAFYLNYGKKVRSQMNILSIMIPIYSFTAITVGILGVSFTGKTLALPANMGHIVMLLGLGLLPTAAAHTLYFSSLSNLKSFETATLALLEPVGATVLGIIFLQELPVWWFVLGAALVLVGILFIIIKES